MRFSVPKGKTIYHRGKYLVGEIPDKIADQLPDEIKALLKDKKPRGSSTSTSSSKSGQS